MTLRNTLSTLLRHACERLVPRLTDKRVLHDREDASLPYLTRYTLFSWQQEEEGPPDARRAARLSWPFSLYLHHVHRSDMEKVLHNHPWKLGVSLILAGGYREQRCKAGLQHVETRDCLPFSINVIWSDDFHRFDLLQDDAWTLFLAGPKFQDWGFLAMDVWAYEQHSAFIQRIRNHKKESDWLAAREFLDSYVPTRVWVLEDEAIYKCNECGVEGVRLREDKLSVHNDLLCKPCMEDCLEEERRFGLFIPEKLLDKRFPPALFPKDNEAKISSLDALEKEGLVAWWQGLPEKERVLP